MFKQKSSEQKILDQKDEAVTNKTVNIFWHIIDRLSSRSKLIANLYEETVGKEYKKEREKFDFSKSKKILHIGGGAYPITAFNLSDLNNVEIVTIDHNKKSIEIAKKMIKEKNLNHKISAKVGNGTDYPLEGFDLIIISGCSFPKIKVINHVLNNAEPNAKIVIREAVGKNNLTDNMDTINNFKIENKIFCKAFPTSAWNSVMVQKNNE